MKFITRSGLIGKKLGMTNMLVNEQFIPVTVIQIPNNYIILEKKTEKYLVVKLGIQKSKRVNKPQAAEMKKNNIPACSVVKEFKFDLNEEIKKEKIKNDLGEAQILSIKHLSDVKFLDVTGTSSGKGFAGAMKKWNFKGGRASHGASLSHRAIGSTGVRDKGWKGKKMPGRMGGDTITVQNLKIVDVDYELNTITVLGAVPGKENGVVYLKKAIKKGESNVNN